MDFIHEQVGEVVVVKLAGRLDISTVAPAEESFGKLVANGAPRLTIDMSQLEYVSSAGLRVLLAVAKKVRAADGKVALFGLVPGVREVFAVSGFDKIFAIYPNSGAAVAAVVG